MEYRQLFESDVWHFHPRCQHWSQTNESGFRATQVEEGERPTTGELCNECLSKSRHPSGQE